MASSTATTPERKRSNLSCSVVTSFSKTSYILRPSCTNITVQGTSPGRFPLYRPYCSIMGIGDPVYRGIGNPFKSASWKWAAQNRLSVGSTPRALEGFLLKCAFSRSIKHYRSWTGNNFQNPNYIHEKCLFLNFNLKRRCEISLLEYEPVRCRKSANERTSSGSTYVS